MVSATRPVKKMIARAQFLGALLLCGVCDSLPREHDEWAKFLGALLLCGVCDE